jgi:hypothetical protein
MRIASLGPTDALLNNIISSSNRSVAWLFPDASIARSGSGRWLHDASVELRVGVYQSLFSVRGLCCGERSLVDLGDMAS